MRVATWNLAGRKNPAVISAQIDEMERWQADIYVITEPTKGLVIGGLPKVESGLRSPGGIAERWVSIHGPQARDVPLPCPLSRMAAAAEVTVNGRSVVVYGSVLPWGSAHKTERDASMPGDTYASMFRRLLREQAHDVAVLQAYHPSSTVIWAGDFNQTLAGAYVVGAKANRQALSSELDRLGLAAWNAEAPHLKDGACTIDLICGPAQLEAMCHEPYRPRLNGKALSDHAGYVVEVDVVG